ncbi:MAG: NAD-glutamate dehydrogenase, partial [Rhodospirillales bacterium]
MTGDEWSAYVRKALVRSHGVLAAPLAEAYLSSLAEADRTNPETEAGLAASLFELGLKTPRCRWAVRVTVDPSKPSRIDLVHPDMPFLLASLGMALAARGIEAGRVAHPILRVRRDASGRLKSMGTKDGASESWMQFVLREPLDEAEGVALRTVFEETLADVRAATGDWFAMRQRVFQAAARQSEPEAKTFLEWIEDGHFTLLGAGRFILRGGRLVASGKGLGLLTHGASTYFDTKALAAGAKSQGLFVTKADRRSTVHRPVLMDLLGVPHGDGRIDLFLGLFTADVYAASALALPWARRTAKAVLDHFGFDPLGHNGRLLANILETLPRDALFQADAAHLVTLAKGILDLTSRSRVALFLLPDPFLRFITALVYVPREGYDTQLRLLMQGLIEKAAGGALISSAVLVNDSALARLHLVVTRPPGSKPLDAKALEDTLARAARGWSEDLSDALAARHGEREGRKKFVRYAKAFPAAYRESVTPQSALADIDRAEALLQGGDILAALEETGGRLAHDRLTPSHPSDAELNVNRQLKTNCRADSRLQSKPENGYDFRRPALLFKLIRAERMIPLSLVLPRLENLGFTVQSELPFRLSPLNGPGLWLHVFEVESPQALNEGLARRAAQAFVAVWRGETEDDAFNRLIAKAGLDWRQAALLRALARYLIQAGGTVSLSYMARVLESHPTAAADLAHFFEASLDPSRQKDDPSAIRRKLALYLDTVSNADEDRILRRFVHLIEATLRTSYFRAGAVMAFKFRSADIDGLPEPKPWAEIWVHGPRVEGIHLRGGPVARGGIRWSDRPEDFRTEILGLMKAQTVKNTVIVPVGAKGGFVLRQPPRDGGRESLLAEGIACYNLFISALLDLTDNLVHGRVVPPANIVRRDGDDPYLVVAADKGTASFSDIANALSLERGFWLGDAFASGGSKGYDHKGMGITAKGAWIGTRRHFRELDIDPEKDVIRVVGVGDMSGDVFGNGLLRSETLKLVGAFDHRHILIDPDPDPKESFKIGRA